MQECWPTPWESCLVRTQKGFMISELATRFQPSSCWIVNVRGTMLRTHRGEKGSNRHRHLKRGDKKRWRCSHTLSSQDSELLSPRFAEQECKLDKEQEISWLISIKGTKDETLKKKSIEVFFNVLPRTSRSDLPGTPLVTLRLHTLKIPRIM